MQDLLSDPSVTTVFGVHTNASEHAIGEPSHYFTSKPEAQIFALRRGWYGSNAEVLGYYTVLIKGKHYLLKSVFSIDLDGVEAIRKEELKKSALAKLTPEEISILGIK